MVSNPNLRGQTVKPANLFADIPSALPEEVIETLLLAEGVRVERIVSDGHATPPGQWYDQKNHEWVLVLRGQAGLLFEGEKEARLLGPGDYVFIPAHQRHRVEWTDPAGKTIWLALHWPADRV